MTSLYQVRHLKAFNYEYIALYCTHSQVEYHPNLLITEKDENCLPSDFSLNSHLQRFGYQRNK